MQVVGLLKPWKTLLYLNVSEFLGIHVDSLKIAWETLETAMTFSEWNLKLRTIQVNKFGKWYRLNLIFAARELWKWIIFYKNKIVDVPLTT